jgi:YebC/PmpR family DNA-binding regulatory protein
MGKSWKNAGKTEAAQKKGLIFTKLAREIAVSAKLGGPDPAGNARLRSAIEAARKAACPNDTIERAIKKGAGLLDDGKIIEEVMYEGYGPHGVGVLVECQTDNRARTVPEIRMIFKKNEGNLGELGSVAWMFERVGMIEGAKAGTFDPEEEAIEAGANEVAKNENEKEPGYEFFTAPDEVDTVREALTKRGWTISKAELSYKAKNITALSEEQLKDVSDFLNELDDHDDTSKVHATI